MKKVRTIKKRGKKEYHHLICEIGKILELGRTKAVYAVNTILVDTYWNIGKQIVEYEQKGKERAEYGSELLEQLAKDLKLRYGKGLNIRNIYLMRRFYLLFKKLQTLSAKLSWSHYVELLGIDEELERNFYEKECISEKWSIRELRRQINSALFHRLALSRDKKSVLNLSKNGQVIEKDIDMVKEPYVLEFLNIPENYKYSEKELEEKIINNLQRFLLELGKGFAFIARQFRITLGNKHFYVDLVFYHRILKCFVLIDLKTGEANHQDIGQMNMYLNYFKREENSEEDNEPIGIVLSTKKNNIEMSYALGGITNKLFVSKYRLYLPDKKELEIKLKMIINSKSL